jgi:small-conductance mechanosensitive channel
MVQSCPINYKKIDATIVRCASFYVVLTLAAFLWTMNPFILLFLGADFIFRVYGLKQFSLICMAATLTKQALRLETRMEDAGAKRLASQFGVLFVLLLIAGVFLDLTLLVYITAAIFIACALLELIIGYCVGCKIYYMTKHFFPGLF